MPVENALNLEKEKPLKKMNKYNFIITSRHVFIKAYKKATNWFPGSYCMAINHRITRDMNMKLKLIHNSQLTTHCLIKGYTQGYA